MTRKKKRDSIKNCETEIDIFQKKKNEAQKYLQLYFDNKKDEYLIDTINNDDTSTEISSYFLDFICKRINEKKSIDEYSETIKKVFVILSADEINIKLKNRQIKNIKKPIKNYKEKIIDFLKDYIETQREIIKKDEEIKKNKEEIIKEKIKEKKIKLINEFQTKIEKLINNFFENEEDNLTFFQLPEIDGSNLYYYYKLKEIKQNKENIIKYRNIYFTYIEIIINKIDKIENINLVENLFQYIIGQPIFEEGLLDLLLDEKGNNNQEIKKAIETKLNKIISLFSDNFNCKFNGNKLIFELEEEKEYYEFEIDNFNYLLSLLKKNYSTLIHTGNIEYFFNKSKLLSNIQKNNYYSSYLDIIYSFVNYIIPSKILFKHYKDVQLDKFSINEFNKYKIFDIMKKRIKFIPIPNTIDNTRISAYFDYGTMQVYINSIPFKIEQKNIPKKIITFIRIGYLIFVLVHEHALHEYRRILHRFDKNIEESTSEKFFGKNKNKGEGGEYFEREVLGLKMSSNGFILTISNIINAMQKDIWNMENIKDFKEKFNKEYTLEEVKNLKDENFIKLLKLLNIQPEELFTPLISELSIPYHSSNEESGYVCGNSIRSYNLKNKD